MTLDLRTNNASVPLGGIDPLFATSGRHAKAADRIGVQVSPFGDKMMRMIVMPGDTNVVGSGPGRDRCEVMTPRIGGTEGGRQQIAWTLALEPDFKAPSSSASLNDMHQPNDGAFQSAWTMWLVGNGTLTNRVAGGPETADRTMGSVREDLTLADLSKGEPHEFILDIAYGATRETGGYAVLMDGRELVPWHPFPTLVAGARNVPVYWKFGHYRPASSWPATYWVGDFLVTSTRAASRDAVKELADYFGWNGAPPMPIPEPAPAPTPAPAPVKLAVSSIQAGDKLPQTSITWKVTTDVPARSVSFLVNGKMVFSHFDGTDFRFEWDTTNLSPGPVNIGFAVTNTDGTLGPAYQSFPVEIVVTTPTPVPPPPADPCADANAKLADARDLCRQQITAWRNEKPARSWAWIKKQPAGQAYYGPLGGK